jgi:hypothetical protein
VCFSHRRDLRLVERTGDRVVGKVIVGIFPGKSWGLRIARIADNTTQDLSFGESDPKASTRRTKLLNTVRRTGPNRVLFTACKRRKSESW